MGAHPRAAPRARRAGDALPLPVALQGEAFIKARGDVRRLPQIGRAEFRLGDRGGGGGARDGALPGAERRERGAPPGPRALLAARQNRARTRRHRARARRRRLGPATDVLDLAAADRTTSSGRARAPTQSSTRTAQLAARRAPRRARGRRARGGAARLALAGLRLPARATSCPARTPTATGQGARTPAVPTDRTGCPCVCSSCRHSPTIWNSVLLPVCAACAADARRPSSLSSAAATALSSAGDLIAAADRARAPLQAPEWSAPISCGFAHAEEDQSEPLVRSRRSLALPTIAATPSTRRERAPAAASSRRSSVSCRVDDDGKARLQATWRGRRARARRGAVAATRRSIAGALPRHRSAPCSRAPDAAICAGTCVPREPLAPKGSRSKRAPLWRRGGRFAWSAVARRCARRADDREPLGGCQVTSRACRQLQSAARWVARLVLEVSAAASLAGRPASMRATTRPRGPPGGGVGATLRSAANANCQPAAIARPAPQGAPAHLPAHQRSARETRSDPSATGGTREPTGAHRAPNHYAREQPRVAREDGATRASRPVVPRGAPDRGAGRAERRYIQLAPTSAGRDARLRPPLRTQYIKQQEGDARRALAFGASRPPAPSAAASKRRRW